MILNSSGLSVTEDNHHPNGWDLNGISHHDPDTVLNGGPFHIYGDL